jgi:hypothetical protein
MLQDMQPRLALELRQRLVREGIANDVGIERMLHQLRQSYTKPTGPLSHEAEWYNDDENLSRALSAMLHGRCDLATWSPARLTILVEMRADERTACGFLPAIFSESTMAALVELHSVDGAERQRAMQTLSELPPSALAQHASLLVARLDDAHDGVRCAAEKALHKVRQEPAALVAVAAQKAAHARSNDRLEPQRTRGARPCAAQLYCGPRQHTGGRRRAGR